MGIIILGDCYPYFWVCLQNRSFSQDIHLYLLPRQESFYFYIVRLFSHLIRLIWWLQRFQCNLLKYCVSTNVRKKYEQTFKLHLIPFFERFFFLHKNSKTAISREIPTKIEHYLKCFAKLRHKSTTACPKYVSYRKTGTDASQLYLYSWRFTLCI